MASVSLLVPRLARVARISYGIVAALGAAAIWGWVLGVPALRDLGADYAAMSPGAALAVLLLATSFFAADGGRPRSAAAAAAVAGAIAAGTLVESLFGVPLGMNFEWLAVGGAELPGDMSIAACITLLLLALVTPLSRDPKIFRASASALAALAVGTVAFFALLGLSLRVLRFDIAAPLLGFSAPAALATMLAPVASACVPPRRPGGRWMSCSCFSMSGTVRSCATSSTPRSRCAAPRRPAASWRCARATGPCIPSR